MKNRKCTKLERVSFGVSFLLSTTIFGRPCLSHPTIKATPSPSHSHDNNSFKLILSPFWQNSLPLPLLFLILCPPPLRGRQGLVQSYTVESSCITYRSYLRVIKFSVRNHIASNQGTIVSILVNQKVLYITSISLFEHIIAS